MSAESIQAGRAGCSGAILGGIAGVVLSAVIYRYVQWGPAMTLIMGALGAMVGARISQALAARRRRSSSGGRRRG